MTSDPVLLTIGELAARTGVGVSTLRAWEERVGFPEATRTRGGQRRFRPADVVKVEEVQRLRERGLSLEEAVDVVRSGDEVGADSMFAFLRRRHPHLDVLTVRARTMLALTWAIEDECLAQASHPLLVGVFQDDASYVAAGVRWRELSRSAKTAVVFADFAETSPDETPARVALPPESPWLNEWSLICLDPELCVALVAWERPGSGTAGDRVFEAVLTTEPAVVRDAVEQAAESARAAGVEWPHDLTLSVASETSGSDGRAVALLRRFASYADQRMR